MVVTVISNSCKAVLTYGAICWTSSTHIFNHYKPLPPPVSCLLDASHECLVAEHSFEVNIPPLPGLLTHVRGSQANVHIKAFHRIQKADRPNNTSLPKIIIPSGTVESTGPTRSGEGCELEIRADVRGTNPLTVRVTTRVVINALSAAGSRIEPRTEPMSYFRAK